VYPRGELPAGLTESKEQPPIADNAQAQRVRRISRLHVQNRSRFAAIIAHGALVGIEIY
jgi:hypothetical protein